LSGKIGISPACRIWHGALPSARSSHDEPFKVPGTWSANSLGDPSSWGAVGLRIGLVASRLGLRGRVPRTRPAPPHGSNIGVISSHRPTRFCRRCARRFWEPDNDLDTGSANHFLGKKI